MNLVIPLLFVACHDGLYRGGETFYLDNDGAVMPVWVTGNVDSGVLVITNHGGPGYSSGLEFHETTGFLELEKDYGFVYWDQRMSGMSRGNPDLDLLTVDQHVEDLDKLVTLIADRYEYDSLFMLGHSWGGGLTLEYLGRDDNQQPFNGFVDIDGAIQDAYEHDLKEEWILPRAADKYDETGDEMWLEPAEWYADNPNPTEADFEPYQFVRWLGGYVYDPELAAERNPSILFKYATTPWSLGWNANQYSDTDWLAGYTFEDSAEQITIPALLIWGKEDGAVPVEAGEYVYDLLPGQDKTLLQIDNCAHSPFYERPYVFRDAMRTFIEANRTAP